MSKSLSTRSLGKPWTFRNGKCFFEIFFLNNVFSKSGIETDMSMRLTKMILELKKSLLLLEVILVNVFDRTEI